MRVIVAGSTIYFKVKARDVTQENKPLFNPAGGVTITVKNPSGSTVVDAVAMTNLTTGIFTYTHQSASGDPKGVWTVSCKAINGLNVNITPNLGVFELT